jgi:ribonuclease HI
MRLHAWTDGASRGNPGEAAIGIIIKSDDGTVIATK